MTQTIFIRLDTFTARASKTGTVLPSIALTLCSAARLEFAFVDAEDVVGPLPGGSPVVKVCVKKRPNDAESLLLLTDCTLSGEGTASRRVAEWSDTTMDNQELRDFLGGEISLTGNADKGPWMEVAITQDDKTDRVSFPITIKNAFLRPEDTAPNPRSDASWPWLKARMPDSSGFTHDDEAKTIAATPAWDAVTGKPSTFTPSGHTHSISDVTGLQIALDGKASTDSVGANNGIAPLDSSGKVPAANLPAFASQAEAEAGADNTTLMTPQRTAQAIAALGGGAPSLPRGHISGLVMAYNNTSTIDVGPGTCRDDSDTVDLVLPSTFSKSVSSTWAAGSGSYGMESGSAWLVSSNYSVWLIYNATSNAVDVLFSASATSPTLPSGYGYKRRIGWVRSTSIGVLTPFVQDGEQIIVNTSQTVADSVTAGLSTSGDTLIPLNGPPSVDTFLRVAASATSGSFYVRLDHTSVTFGAVAADTASLWGVGTTSPAAGHYTVLADSSSQIRVRGGGGTITLRITVRGWRDTRGRFD